MKSSEEGEEEKQDRHVPGGFGTSAPRIPAAVRISIVPAVSLVTEQSGTGQRRARRPEYKRETRRMERKRSCCKIANEQRGRRDGVMYESVPSVALPEKEADGASG